MGVGVKYSFCHRRARAREPLFQKGGWALEGSLEGVTEACLETTVTLSISIPWPSPFLAHWLSNFKKINKTLSFSKYYNKIFQTHKMYTIKGKHSPIFKNKIQGCRYPWNPWCTQSPSPKKGKSLSEIDMHHTPYLCFYVLTTYI